MSSTPIDASLLFGLSALTLFPWPALTYNELDHVRERCGGWFWVFRTTVLGLLTASYYLYIRQLTAFLDAAIILMVVSLVLRQAWRYYFFHDTKPYAWLFSWASRASAAVLHGIVVGFSYDTAHLAPFVVALLVVPWDVYATWLAYAGHPQRQAAAAQDIETGLHPRLVGRGPGKRPPPSTVHRIKRPGRLAERPNTRSHTPRIPKLG